MVKQALFRWTWLILFVAQIVLYFQSYPHLAPITAKNDMPGGSLVNILALDILGGGCWAVVLLLSEDMAKEQKKGLIRLYYGVVVLCTILALGVAYINVHSWV